jgi:hypothetical protein
MIEGTPRAIAQILHLADGEESKQETLFQVPDKMLFVIEAVGVNAFLQPNQGLMVSVEPVLDNGAFVFPIALHGESFYSQADLPYRRFGSQSLILYADTRIDIIAYRIAANGKAQIEFNVSGRLVEAEGS